MEDLVKVMSREILKPSSQTSFHPKKVKLSYIDQWLPPIYIPLIFFYEADESRGLTTSNHHQISQQLKHSLLHILPSFYPLAGRIKKNLFVDCNDAGVEFVVARAHAHLDDVVCQDDRLKQYLPTECTAFNHGRQPLLVVQISFFECGGLVISACISHKISDMACAMEFVNAWAAAFRGEVETVRPSFRAASYFPPLRLVPWSRSHKMFTANENLMSKRFVFNKEKLDILREAATSSSESSIKNPSRVELVSAFIWKHFMAARLQNKQKPKKIYAAFHAVNVRPRTSPPQLLENVYGNCFLPAMAVPAWTASPDELRIHELIGGLRSSIGKVRGSCITKPKNNVRFIKDLSKLAFQHMMGKVDWCFFTSWRGFPTYDTDFGWGRPVRFTTPSMPVKNLIILISSKSGDDIEATVTMMPDDIQFLDAHIKLISTTPPFLKI